MRLSALLILTSCLVKGANWAILIAGSRSWSNYRHQADVCHAYHIVHNVGGIPEDNIIVMMADDIAYNDENPYPGNIINVPNGENVYLGVPKDYTGEDVNKNTLKNVLLGESGSNASHNSQKVLRSTEEDNVFIYYSDHGAKGLILMPYGDPLYADELGWLLQEMRIRKMFKNLVFYLEACESGSMFDGFLPKDMGIYAMTASAADEPSFAYFWDSDRRVYLADEFSINWIVDSESNMTASYETIERQFETTKARTNESHVHQYGDLEFVREPIEEFQGIESAKKIDPITKITKVKRGVPQWDVRLESLKQMLLLENDIATKAEIQKLIDLEILHRHSTEYIFRMVVSTTVPQYDEYNRTLEYWMDVNLQPRNFTALRNIWLYTSEKCVGWGEYSIQFWSVLVSLCESFGELALVNGMNSACDKLPESFKEITR